MQPNRVKKILREGGLALGTYTGGIADPQVVEIIGHAGFDAAFIDMEHTSFDLRDVQLMVMAAERVGITPIVRTPGFDPAFILRLLDMGVQGIQLPHVGDARAAREAVRAVRYAPLGERGMAGASRAADYGKIPVTAHIEQSNREITLAVMIEDLAAVVLMVMTPELGSLEEPTRVLGLALALGKSAIILAPFWYLSSKVFPPLMTRAARTRSPELFLLFALAVGLGTAAATQAMGLSVALGAFLAGLIISESDYAHEALARQTGHLTPRLWVAELEKLPRHMRPQGGEGRGGGPRRDTVLRVTLDGRRLLERVYRPGGVRHDGPTFVYEELPLSPGVHRLEATLAEASRSPASGGAASAGERRLAADVEVRPEQVLLLELSAEHGLVLR